MNELSKDLIILLALKCGKILPLCMTSKRMKEIIFDNETFWMNKVKKNYPNDFNKLVRKSDIGWKNLYKRIYNFKMNNLIHKESASSLIKGDEWRNPAGLLYNKVQGWSFREDKHVSNIVYLHPTTFTSLQSFILGITPQGGNHSTHMIKVEFTPKPVITKIPWDNDILGRSLFYKSGDRKIFWHDDLYFYGFEFDGKKYEFNTYLPNKEEK